MRTFLKILLTYTLYMIWLKYMKYVWKAYYWLYGHCVTVYDSSIILKIRSFIYEYLYIKFYIPYFLPNAYDPFVKFLSTGSFHHFVTGTYWYTSLIIICLALFYIKLMFKLYRMCWWYIIAVLYIEDLEAQPYASYIGMLLTFIWWVGFFTMYMILICHHSYTFGTYSYGFDFISFFDVHFQWYFTFGRSIFFVGYPSTKYDNLFPDHVKFNMRKEANKKRYF